MERITGTLDRRQLNVAVLTIANRLMPCGWDVGVDAPSTYEELVEHYETTGRIKVWDGASDRTIYDDDGDHEWGDDSPCRCHNCGWQGKVAQTKLKGAM